MIRRLLSLAVLLVGCARAAPAHAPIEDGGFPTPEARMLACLDLQDRIVDLYVAEYVAAHADELDSLEREAFRQGWGDELAKGGTFERFDSACAGSLTKAGYGCAVKAGSPGDLAGCLRRTRVDSQ